MHQQVDLDTVVEASVDAGYLQLLVQQLVGQPFFQIRFSYGDELTIHFGVPRAYTSPKLRHLERGSYILAARSSMWHISSPATARHLFLAPESPNSLSGSTGIAKEEIEKNPPIQKGAVVLNARVIGIGPVDNLAGYGLTLQVSDGTRLMISPASDEFAVDQDADVSDWELLAPHDRILKVGPGIHWSYTPSRSVAGTGA